MWPTLMQWDLDLLHQINGVWIHPALDKVMAVVSDFDLFKIPLLVLIVALLAWGKYRERLFLFIMLWCVVIGDMVIDSGLKTWVRRPRPHEVLATVRRVEFDAHKMTDVVKMAEPVERPKGRSFPSGHTFNNVSIALAATVLYGRWALLLWPWAFLVSYSRIYTGSHYPSDVLASVVIALAYTWAILRLLEWMWSRWGQRALPGLYAKHPRLIFSQTANPITFQTR
jgi:undecaprenyl-diphosphatase